MFNWFWEFLYMISKTIFRLIDGLILCANKLCGIDPINFDGEETDFLSYLLLSDEIGFAFRVAAVLATILLVVFTVFMIIRSISKEKVEGTPTQIAVKSFKTLLMFFIVPAVMIAFMAIGNAFVKALYSATTQAASTPGAFLFSAFATDGGMPAESVELFRTGELLYTDTDIVAAHMGDLSNFPFFFSWLAGGVVLFCVGSSMLIFVDRVISIVILYIVSPISISTSVLDDGARFKLWRDQFLSKFIMGYGMILAINIYALVCGLVMKPGFAFLADSPFLDLIMKLLVIGGGALTMQKSMALIGNLVSSGAGSNELRDNAVSAGGLAKKAGGALGMVTGARAIKSIVGDAIAMKSRDLGSKLLDKMHMGIGGNTTDKNGVKDPSGSSDSQNNQKANYGSNNNNSTKAAINNGAGFNVDGWDSLKKGDNSNNSKPDNKKENTVNNVINNSGPMEQKSNRNEGENK